MIAVGQNRFLIQPLKIQRSKSNQEQAQHQPIDRDIEQAGDESRNKSQKPPYQNGGDNGQGGDTQSNPTVQEGIEQKKSSHNP